jgi:hypothetical protein
VNAVDALPGVSGLTGRIEGTESGGTLELASRNASLTLEQIFRAPLVLETLDARGSWKHANGALEVSLQDAKFSNPDAEGTVSGSWRSNAEAKGKSPGSVDLKGHLTRASAKSVAAYMPNRISNTRDWLERSIQAGTSPRVDFVLKGELAEFPFGGESKGLFLVEGDLREGRLKYHPDWPSVDRVNGTFRFENRRMEIRADKATIFASRGNTVAAIEDLAVRPAVLTVAGDVDTSGADTIRFLRESPLVKGPGAFTRVVSVEGPGKLHFDLTYPLAAGEIVQVKGEYVFDGAGRERLENARHEEPEGQALVHEPRRHRAPDHGQPLRQARGAHDGHAGRRRARDAGGRRARFGRHRSLRGTLACREARGRDHVEGEAHHVAHRQRPRHLVGPEGPRIDASSTAGEDRPRKKRTPRSR